MLRLPRRIQHVRLHFRICARPVHNLAAAVAGKVVKLGWEQRLFSRMYFREDATPTLFFRLIVLAMAYIPLFLAFGADAQGQAEDAGMAEPNALLWVFVKIPGSGSVFGLWAAANCRALVKGPELEQLGARMTVISDDEARSLRRWRIGFMMGAGLMFTMACSCC